MGEQADLDGVPLTETDRKLLAGGDEKYVMDTWDDLKRIIGRTNRFLLSSRPLPVCFPQPASGNISVLKRKPSDLIRYINWSKETKATYGSMTNFICKERLHWSPLPDSTAETGPLFACESQTPFASPRDYQILLNDWPYGIAPNISHIVVWLKNHIAVQPPEGYLLPESERLIEDFVQKVFVDKLKAIGQGHDQVLWFKNWVSLQSVRGLDHVHVMVRDAPQAVLDEWTRTSA